ncbi:MAG: MutL protein [Chloroflexota bacterium]|nr:MAG: MutL protein [Chloroflexota bacterium]
MKVTLLVDIGSTNTKITAVDLERERILGRTHAPSTVSSDMTIGLKAAYQKLLDQIGEPSLTIEKALACSSAAGGLRMVAIGLVPVLTTEAARMAALGAGAKLVGTYSYKLSRHELNAIQAASPDIILLAGGTDGGNTEVILHNAQVLADSDLSCPVIVCGNKVVADDAAMCLEAAGKTVNIVDNVLPELNRLNVEACRSIIREIFINRIVHGKGLDKAQEFLGTIAMPTPLAVMKAAQLMAQGTENEEGLGELMVVDIGGATTDVVSIAEGAPTQANVVLKGLPEPYCKRTVEGDLGIRYNASNILKLVGEKKLKEHMRVGRDAHVGEADVAAKVMYLTDHIESIPQTREDLLIDIGLARSAACIAVRRHAGSIEAIYSPMGSFSVQCGKDLTQVKMVVGTGGVVSYGMDPHSILEATRFGEECPTALCPRQPAFCIDKEYILYAVGLLSEIAPDKAMRIARANIMAGAIGTVRI